MPRSRSCSGVRGRRWRECSPSTIKEGRPLTWWLRPEYQAAAEHAVARQSRNVMPAAGRFSPGIIDYDDMSVRYQCGRALSEEAAKTWSAAVAPFIQDSARPRILDLGAGTG